MGPGLTVRIYYSRPRTTRQWFAGFGLPEYVRAYHGHRDPEWGDRYEPLRTTLDPSTVPFWDFNTLLWVGPSEYPCLVWTNAEFSLLGIVTTFGKNLPGNIVR